MIAVVLYCSVHTVAQEMRFCCTVGVVNVTFLPVSTFVMDYMETFLCQSVILISACSLFFPGIIATFPFFVESKAVTKVLFPKSNT